MKFLLVGVVLGALGGAYLYDRWRRSQADTVSDAWLAAQEQQERQAGIDGVAWQFPVRKLQNEAAPFNTRKLRRRAS